MSVVVSYKSGNAQVSQESENACMHACMHAAACRVCLTGIYCINRQLNVKRAFQTWQTQTVMIDCCLKEDSSIKKKTSFKQ